MPKSRRPKPLYQRGPYRLDRRPDRTFLTITWYDPARKRERVSSAGTSDVEIGKRALDALYLAEGKGENICPTCGQPIQSSGSLVTTVIADYMIAQGEKRTSAEAIRHRLAHVVAYIETLTKVPTCDEITPAWIDRFRAWLTAKPIVSKVKGDRQRSLSTVENSVLQFAAAINWGKANGYTDKRAQFRALPTKDVNRTPQYRADVATLARMLAYATDPRIAKRRLNLARFLRISIASLGRPDAAHDVSVDPARQQWNGDRHVLNLNPKGRRQTNKYRPIVPIVPVVAAELDALAADVAENAKRPVDERVSPYFVNAESVKSAFETMVDDLGLPRDGESGMKLIRRSMADILRNRLEEDESGIAQLETFLGHRAIDSTTELYAPFSPRYLRKVRDEIAMICDEIAKAVPTAFYHTVATHTPRLRVVTGGGNG